jgi:Na+:H+ antiporter, NhaA family
MGVVQQRLSKTFRRFLNSNKSGGILLIICTVVSLAMANSPLGENYLSIWKMYVGGLSVGHWINDLLMAIFFLLIGLELERELYNGELSNFKNALLPLFAALGGILVPAAIHFSLNVGTPTQAGVGIPMATDIAFAIGVLAILGNRVPASLKVFLVALAVIDDLCAIIVIAVFYTAELSVGFLAASLAVWTVLIAINRVFKVKILTPYLIGGAIMWYFMLKSGVHATIAGVLLAFAIPFSVKEDDATSPSHRLEHFLHKPVSFVILPVFALANTGIVIGADAFGTLTSTNSLGILTGLFLGKPLGIFLLTFLAVTFGISKLPLDLAWRHVLGAGMLGGIGFTMSIFITNLAFEKSYAMIDSSKMAILLASLASGIAGFIWLTFFGRPTGADTDADTMDFDVTDIERNE